MRNVPYEADEQKAIFEWIGYNIGRFPEMELCLHIPNGGYRNPREAHNLRLQGVKSGVPDLFLPVARGGWHGLFIELKRQKGGRLSEDQKAWIDALNEQHYYATVAQGAEEACDVIFKYLTEEAEQ